MSSFQVVRIKSRAELSFQLYRHIIGSVRPVSARAIADPVVVLEEGWEDAREQVELFNLGYRGKRGRRANQVVEVLLAGPPRYATAEEWCSQTEAQWARAAVGWCRDLMGSESVVVAAALHRDEAAPHVHFLFVPIHEGRLGWCRVRDASAQRFHKRADTKPRTPGRKYTCFQDDFQAQVGKRFGLARGQSGVPGTNQKVNFKIGLEESIRILTVQRDALAKEIEREGIEGRAALQRTFEAQERELAEKLALQKRRALDVAAAKSLFGRPSAAQRGRTVLNSAVAQVTQAEQRADAAEARVEQVEAERGRFAEAAAEAKRQLSETERRADAAEAQVEQVEAEQERERAEAQAAREAMTLEIQTAYQAAARLHKRDGEQFLAGKRQGRAEADANSRRVIYDLEQKISQLTESVRNAYRRGVIAYTRGLLGVLSRTGWLPDLQADKDTNAALAAGAEGRVPGVKLQHKHGREGVGWEAE